MKQAYIFSHSTADLKYVLSIYNELIENQVKISIFVINNNSNFVFLSKVLPQNKNIFFIAYPGKFSLKNPISIIRAKKYLNKIAKEYFLVQDFDVYFFTNLYDWVSWYFLKSLNETCKIYFVDYIKYDLNANIVNKLSLKENIRLFWLQNITGVELSYCSFNGNNQLCLGAKDIKYNKIGHNINHSIYKKHSYTVPNLLEKSIILYENNQKNYNNILNYDNTLKQIIDLVLLKGFHLYLKPHPRIGYSDFIKEYKFDELPSYIPGEFINITSFDFCFGIETATVAYLVNHFNSNNTYTLIDLFDFVSDNKKESYKNWLINLSDNKIKFISSIEMLEDLISKVN